MTQRMILGRTYLGYHSLGMMRIRWQVRMVEEPIRVEFLVVLVQFLVLMHSPHGDEDRASFRNQIAVVLIICAVRMPN